MFLHLVFYDEKEAHACYGCGRCIIYWQCHYILQRFGIGYLDWDCHAQQTLFFKIDLGVNAYSLCSLAQYFS